MRALSHRGIATLLAATALVQAQPAHATGTLSCTGLEGADVAVEMNLALAPVLKPLWVRLSVADRTWTSLPGEAGTPVAILQSFAEGGRLAVDIADEGAEGLTAALRIDLVEEGNESLRIGYLRVHGAAVYPITCEGP